MKLLKKLRTSCTKADIVLFSPLDCLLFQSPVACTIKKFTIVIYDCYDSTMRLYHPPDGSTSPKYNLLCFKLR